MGLFGEKLKEKREAMKETQAKSSEINLSSVLNEKKDTSLENNIKSDIKEEKVSVIKEPISEKNLIEEKIETPIILEKEKSNIADLSEEEKDKMASEFYRYLPDLYKKETKDKIIVNGKSDLNMEDLFSSLLTTLLIGMSFHGISDFHAELYGDETFRIKWRKNKILKEITKTDLIETFDGLNLSKYGASREKCFRIFDILGKEELIFDFKNPREYHFGGKEFLTELVSKFIMDGNNFNNAYKSFDSRRIIKYPFQGKLKKCSYRIVLIPTKFDGETIFNIVIRLLEGKYRKSDYKMYSPIIKENLSGNGLFIVGGETNSGKSTSVTRGMYELHDLYPNKKFFSVENPIENPLPFATQLEVNIPIDRNKDNLMDFSDFNRSLFRRDGDIINLGEIRDKETAESSIELSISGHNIFSTIHISNVFNLFARVKRFKIDPEEALSITRLVVVQKLIPTYHASKGVLIKDLKTSVGNSIYDSLIEYNNTGKANIIIKNFYRRTNRYKTLIKNNVLLEDNIPEKKEEFLNALENIDSFCKFLSNNYYYYNTKTDPNIFEGQTLFFEILQINERNQDFILNPDKKELFEVEDVFLPMFINRFFSNPDKNFLLSEITELSTLIY